MMHPGFQSAEELRQCRKKAGWTQKDLARLSGFHVCTVKYHERRKGRVDGVAPARFREILIKAGIKVSPVPFRSSRPMVSTAEMIEAEVERRFRQEQVRLAMKQASAAKPQQEAKSAPARKCGAKTRKGNPCMAKALPGTGRCKLHGGMSTGPKSAEGRERIARAMRERHEIRRRLASGER